MMKMQTPPKTFVPSWYLREDAGKMFGADTIFGEEFSYRVEFSVRDRFGARKIHLYKKFLSAHKTSI